MRVLVAGDRGYIGPFWSRSCVRPGTRSMDSISASMKGATLGGIERFLFASSCSLYGAARSAAVAEDADLFPVTPYGEAKVAAELGLSLLADDRFSPTYLRRPHLIPVRPPTPDPRAAVGRPARRHAPPADQRAASLYVPAGCAHGFQALTDPADVSYRIDRAHDPAEDVSIAFDDPELAILWPLPVAAISRRDRLAQPLATATGVLT